MLHGTAGGYVPVNRYLTPGGMLKYFGNLMSLVMMYGKLKKWDVISVSGDIKLITIEEFRGHDTIDLRDADLCNKVYMTEAGYVPPCIYNTKYRKLSWLKNGKKD